MSPCNHFFCGCSYGARCCLDCPLAACIQEHAHDIRRAERQKQASLAVAMLSDGVGPEEIATVLGTSRRTVSRYLASARP